MDSVRLAKVTASNNGSRGVGPFAVDEPEDLDVALRSHTRPRATFSTASTLRLTTPHIADRIAAPKRTCAVAINCR